MMPTKKPLEVRRAIQHRQHDDFYHLRLIAASIPALRVTADFSQPVYYNDLDGTDSMDPNEIGVPK
jgi:hypothetical protein